MDALTLNRRETRGHFKRWRLAEPDARAPGLAAELRLPELVAELLCLRGVADAEAARKFLHPKLTDLHDPASLPGCVMAAERLAAAVRDRQPIVIYGDYDVDGVTATAILFHILKAADPQADVRRYVPHRLEEGYGLNAGAIAKLCDTGARLIVSVDCGITAVEPAAVAKSRGVDLIVTDHHQMAARLPDAFAIVHPRLPAEEPYPFPDICGAGVAYKLAWQFARVWCGGEHVTDKFKQTLVDLLPLAALGTIADVVPLVGENRVIVSHGLRRVKHTPWAGLNALIDASGLRDEKIDSYHVGFVLAPRLNACGRMGHAREAVKLLTDPDPEEAARIARFLNAENDRRRAEERRMFDQAKAMIAEAGYDKDECSVIVLSRDDWHPGVVGIVCSRLVEKFGRPAVMLATANGEGHGSARSIDGFDLHAAFTACSAHLVTYGGHAMAAGLRLAAASVDTFRQAILDHARPLLTPDQFTPVLDLDAEVSLADLTADAVHHLQSLQPFGRGNRSPTFLVTGVELKQPATVMGAAGKHLCLITHQENPAGGSTAMRCVAWNLGHLQPRFPAGTTLDLAVEPKLNHYNGRTTVELHLADFHLLTQHPRPTAPAIEVHRGS